ncbi:MAG TPA: hypothetical protein VN923_07580 [Thermoanaerobaculia bacterium]|nr:hypothetical protein [Thermoanaerobaculia bacterium]
MDLVVRAFPIIPGKEEQLRTLAREMQTRRAADARAFFDRFGVARESWHVQQTPYGTWIIGVTQITGMPIPVAAEEYSRSERPFDRWFKNQVHELSGINPDEQPLGPPTECIFDTAALEPAPADA